MTNTIDIPVPNMFNFQINLQFLNRNPYECMHEVTDNAFIKYIEIGPWKNLIKINAPRKDTLRLHFLTGSIPTTQAETSLFVDYVYHLFDLHKDLQYFYKLAEKDPLLQDTIKQFYGLRIIQIPDLFEALAWGILGQQINITFAYQLKRELVETYGESIEYNGKTYWLFPKAEKIAQLNVDELAKIKMTRRKSEYMIGVAKLLHTGSLTKDKLLQLPSKEAMEKELVKIRGIGPWTANYLLMRCFGLPNAFPIDDVGLHNAIKKQLQLKEKPKKEKIIQLAKNWEGFEAYATFYLWWTLY